MTQIKNIDDKRIFQAFYSIPLMDHVIETLKKKLYETYYIDYMGIHILDNRNEYMISRLDHFAWHDYYWQKDEVRKCPSLAHLGQMKPKESGLLFFKTYQTGSFYNLRGEIIGKVSPGCSFLFVDEMTGYRIQFCITFKDNQVLDSLNTNILLQLVSDLNKNKDFLNPFMEYFINVGNLSHSKDLDQFVNNKIKDFKIS